MDQLQLVECRPGCHPPSLVFGRIENWLIKRVAEKGEKKDEKKKEKKRVESRRGNKGGHRKKANNKSGGMPFPIHC